MSASHGLTDADGAALTSLLCLDDMALAAMATLPEQVWDFIDGGSGDEVTLRRNVAAFQQVELVSRVLAGVHEPELGVRLPATTSSMPVVIAPMAYQCWVHPDGELATARAAAAYGVPFTVSTMASRGLEEIAETRAPLWLQLYWLRDRGRTVELIRRAEAAGYTALVLTVDMPVMARRRRDVRHGLRVPEHISAVNVRTVPAADRAGVPDVPPLASATNAAFDPSLSWSDVAWLKATTTLPLLVKGVLDPRDAVRAADAGVDGLVVSNHGGRQLDGVVPAIAALPDIVSAVCGRCSILLDGGVRSGRDVVKAIALGASAVMLGRPVLWGLAIAGEAGVRRALSLVRAELTEALALTGCADPAAAADLRTRTPW